MRWNSAANWSPQFSLWRRARFLNRALIRAAPRLGEPDRRVSGFPEKVVSCVRHLSIVQWIMKSGRLDPGPEKRGRVFARTSRDRQRRVVLQGKLDFADQTAPRQR